MACLVVAAWTWAAATALLDGLPGWALICAAIGGAALGMQLMILVFQDDRPAEHGRAPSLRARRLEIVRRPTGSANAAAPIRGERQTTGAHART